MSRDVCPRCGELSRDGLGSLPWRVGTHVGRTVYDAQDNLIGTMDTPALAAQVVAAVNERELAR